MREYVYIVRNPSGRRLRGRMRAESEPLLRGLLREQGYQVESVEDQGPIRRTPAEWLRLVRAPSLLDKAVAIRQFATMLNAGVPITRALDVLSRHPESPRLARAWQEVQRDVEHGGTLSRGMARNSDVFGLLYVGLARAGEVSGALGAVMDHLATLLEREARLAARVRAAMAYPALVLAFSLGVAFLIVSHVLPTFLNGVIRGVQDLPWSTRLLVLATDATRNPYLVGVALVGGGVGAFLLHQHLGTPRGRYQFETFLLRAPVVSGIHRRLVLARFCRILATLLRSGTTAVHALEVTGQSLAHSVVSEAVDGIRTDLKDGCSVAAAFEASGLFPPMAVRLLAVAEESGSLEATLARLADFYDEELELAMASFAAALEPLMVALLGAFVAFVLVALFTPLYQLLNAL